MKTTEIERGLIGSIIVNHDVIDLIKPDFFTDSKSIAVLENIIKLKQDGKPIDAITAIPKGINAEFISECIELMPSSQSVVGYIEILKEAKQLRDIRTSLMTALDCANENKKPIEIIGQIESILNKQILENENVKIKPLDAIVVEFFNQYNKIVQNGGKTIGISSGFDDLDAFTGGLVGGELIIIGARSSMGKTLFTLNIAQNVSKNHNVLFCSIEMTAIELLVRMIARELHYNIQDIRNALLTSGQIDKMVAETAKIVSLNLHINDNGYIMIEDILSQAREMKRKKDIKLLVVDHIGLVLTRERFERRDLQIGYITRRLKELAKELDITVIGVAQLNRENKDRKEKAPILTDLRDSGNIEQDANVVILLHREYYYTKNESDKNKAKIIIAKNRNGEVGEFDIGFYGWRGCFETLRNHSESLKEDGKPFIKNSLDNF